MAGRIPVDEHAAFVRSLLAGLGARPTERVALADALGRITASPVESPIALPPFRNSQMDGFAVRAADVADAPVVAAGRRRGRRRGAACPHRSSRARPCAS